LAASGPTKTPPLATVRMPWATSYRASLLHEAGRAGLERLEQLPPLWHHGEDEDPCPTSQGNDPTRGLESAAARHEQVHYDDVRPRGCGARDGLVAAPGLAHDPKAAPPLEQRAQASAEDGVIVH